MKLSELVRKTIAAGLEASHARLVAEGVGDDYQRH